jgi:hypothetical protein
MYKIRLEQIPGGYAASGGRAGDPIQVIYREFTSTEDGQLFVSRLEGFPTEILEKISGSANFAASSTSSLLAIIHRDKTAIVYWNEFHPTVKVRAKGKIKKGELVLLDHIMDIEEVVLPPELARDDVGIVYVFSFGWRKALFFDFGPAQPGERARARDYNLGATLGHYLARLLFQHLFSIGDQTWDELFRQGWFPFAYLKVDIVRSMIARAAEGLSVDDELDVIAKDVQRILPERLEEWRRDEIVSEHLTVINRAYERFEQNDHISAASILYPRVEGIMRSLHKARSPGATASQKELAKSGAGRLGSHPVREESLLLPARFEKYLREVYFASFNPRAPKHRASRNTVSHGVVAAEFLDRKSAVIGFLILLQLYSTITSTREHVEALDSSTDEEVQTCHSNAGSSIRNWKSLLTALIPAG